METKEYEMSKAKVKKKPVLKAIVVGQKVSRLCGEEGEYRLEVGDNAIDVVDKDGKYIRKKIVTYTGDDSQVVKSMQDETDIKNILQKYGRTGMLPIVKDEALYGDFSDMPTFQEAQNIIIKAEKQFEGLNSDVRKKFDNDPAKFLEFCSKEENYEEMVKLGLAKAKEQPSSPVKVEVINQTGGNDEGKNG
jgi:phage internal scaffolding protein